jgi:DNA polymerase-3 subunit gamma/tau
VPFVSLALYRTYRPGRFGDVVGQDHVTQPLRRAIEKNRVHHAYLFSGPRGCGKTSCARILARSLNCEQGPTPEPCGVCDSCVQLAPNGPGSLDVIELDAATHGLVDDARELRERAHFAPVSARYKIYIIDEAHQLGPGAANALLKIIEEPPPHVKFVFATTAPDKLLPTIRSRTHHYPFRLVPARLLQGHLAWVCEQEQVRAEVPALDLVARAGAGSVRDSMSVLGQLIAGAGPDGVTYDLAYDQLGFTDAALLDGIVLALATDDGASVFHAVDRVVETGHDPRRFLTDLLERLRDLIVVQNVPDAFESGLVAAPDDQAARMVEQAAAFGRADLVRLAEVADDGIVTMRGTTPTRLQLELVCSRLLLPGTEDGLPALQARLDRLERSLARGASTPPPAAAAPPALSPTPAVAGSPTSGTSGQPPADASLWPPKAGGPVVRPAPTARPPAAPPAAGPPTGLAAVAPAGPPGPGLAEVRRAWPEVLERLRELRKTPWTFVKDNTEPVEVDGDVLTLGVRSARLRDTLVERDDYSGYLQQALLDTLGRRWRIDAVVHPPASAPGTPPGSPPAMPAPGPPNRGRRGRPEPQQPPPSLPPEPPSAAAEPGIDPDDQVLDDVSGADLLSRELGATVIDVVDDA